MKFLFFLHYLSITCGIHSISELDMGERMCYMHQFLFLYSLFWQNSGVYLPPAIVKKIPMCGMKIFLIRRMLAADKLNKCRKKRTRVNIRIINSSFEFLKFMNFLHDPFRMSVKTFTDKRCQKPIACC